LRQYQRCTFYNDVTSRVKAMANEMEDFSLEFLTIAERNFHLAMPKLEPMQQPPSRSAAEGPA
jgi:hypothetical protein